MLTVVLTALFAVLKKTLPQNLSWPSTTGVLAAVLAIIAPWSTKKSAMQFPSSLDWAMVADGLIPRPKLVYDKALLFELVNDSKYFKYLWNDSIGTSDGHRGHKTNVAFSRGSSKAHVIRLTAQMGSLNWNRSLIDWFLLKIIPQYNLWMLSLLC